MAAVVVLLDTGMNLVRVVRILLAAAALLRGAYSFSIIAI
jgi:hypothetical protein